MNTQGKSKGGSEWMKRQPVNLEEHSKTKRDGSLIDGDKDHREEVVE